MGRRKFKDHIESKKHTKLQEQKDWAEVQRYAEENEKRLEKFQDPGHWKQVEEAVEKAERELEENPFVDLQEWTVVKAGKRSRNQRKREAENKKPQVWSMLIEEVKVEEAVNSIKTIWPEGLCRVHNREEYVGWSEIVFTVDSGASETVIGLDCLSAVPLIQGIAAQNDVKYECANGAIIKNLGEKKFVGTWFAGSRDGRGVSRPMTAQVTSVNKALMSVGKLEDGGYEVHFGGAENSYIKDMATGERMWMEKNGAVYNLRLWVKNPTAIGQGFHRQEM